MSKDDQATTYTYNGLNQLTEADLPDATVNYTYDSRGNQIQEQNETTGITTSFTYAVTGDMTVLSVSGGDTAAYTQENTYNHEGIRISKSEGGVTRRYYYDNGIVAYTKDGTSVSSSNILSADGDILGTYRDSAYYTYTKDAQNSTESIIKSDGTLAAAYTYIDFGETSELTGSSFDNEICYTGAIYDAESGLYYMNARYYDPENGRFISQDTYRGELDELDQWHLYAYCANNPINYVDPSGHWRIKTWMLADAIDFCLSFTGIGLAFNPVKHIIKKAVKSTRMRTKAVKMVNKWIAGIGSKVYKMSKGISKGLRKFGYKKASALNVYYYVRDMACNKIKWWIIDSVIDNLSCYFSVGGFLALMLDVYIHNGYYYGYLWDSKEG